MENTVPPAGKHRWPLVFFLLNLAAIVLLVFLLTGREEKQLAILGMTPGGETVDAAAVSALEIRFSRELDPSSVTRESLRLVPSVRGRTELATPDTLRFLPAEPLRAATRYAVILSPSTRGKGGELPPKDLIEFSTTRFEMVSADQVGSDRNSFTIELSFNHSVAAADLADALIARFSAGGSGSDSRVTVIGNSTQRRQRLQIRETRPGWLLLTLPKGLTSSLGPLGLAEEKQLLWKIVSRDQDDPGAKPEWAGDLAERSLRPDVRFQGMEAEWRDDGGAIIVRTTTALDVEQAKDYVKISPPLPVTFATAWNGLRILGDFQPGRQYRVTLKQGFPAGFAGSLSADISRQVWFDDLPPRLSFAHGGGFLSPHGMLKVAVKSRNVDVFNLGVKKLYSSNIVEALLQDYEEVESTYAEPEITRRVATEGGKNRERETVLDLRDIVGDEPLGVYGLEIWRDDLRWSSRSAIVAVSDLGLSAREGRDSLLVWSTSIREGAPAPRVRVSVYSNKRQIIAEGLSGADGTVELALPAMAPDEKAALILGEGADGEYSFVRLDRDVRPRPPEVLRGPEYAANYQVFLAAERGVYRGGEKALLAGLARNGRVDTVPGLPLELRLLGPDRREIYRRPAVSDNGGRFSVDAQLGRDYPAGVYTVEARLPGQEGVLGSAIFRIADYLPETLSVDMELDKTAEAQDDGSHLLTVKVSRLAGGDVAGMPVEVTVNYAPADFHPEGWEGWNFGDQRVESKRLENGVGSISLKPDGTGEARWSEPDIPSPAAVRMSVRAEASESGGRSASGTVDRTIHMVPYYTGVSPLDRQAEAGKPLPLRIAAVSPDGSVFNAPGEWSAELFRIDHQGVMKRNAEGMMAFEWIRKQVSEAKLSGIWNDGRSLVTPLPLAGGSYRLAVDTEDGLGCTYDFDVRGPGAAWHGEDPERLALKLDAEHYPVGGTATVSVAAPFSGKALLTVETDRILLHRNIDMRQGDNSFDIKVDELMRPNAYVSLTLIRPAVSEGEWRPHRLSGAARLAVDNTDRKLDVAISHDGPMSPGADAEIQVTVRHGDKPVKNASVALWGVDAGILSLTGYKNPSPWEWFYQARKSGVREADMFSRLSPELSSWLGADAAPGGDSGWKSEFTRRLNPIFADRVRAAVVYNAELTTGEDGSVTAVMRAPQFAGQLRFMCWAAKDALAGAAYREIEVKASVSAQAEWPRFAAPGDEFDLPVTVVNRSGAAGEIAVAVSAPDNLSVSPQRAAIVLEDEEAGEVVFRVKALEAGKAEASVTARLGDAAFSEVVELPVRLPVLFARSSGMATIPPGGSGTFILAPDLLKRNSSVKMLAGGSPEIDLAGCMESLIDYPYGCAEQTASRLLALVSLPDLLALSRPDQFKSEDAATAATVLTERLSHMQKENGALKMWPSSGEELFWVSTQALYSLIEAKRQGHPVPDGTTDRLARYLANRIDSFLDEHDLAGADGESVALACLALARTERLNRSWLLRLQEIAEAKSEQHTPLASAALARLTEAAAAAGDPQAARELYERFKPGGVMPGLESNPRLELAAWLTAAMAAGAEQAEIDSYAVRLNVVLKDGYTHWTTTENAMVLAALGRYWGKSGPVADSAAAVRLNGRMARFSTRDGGKWDRLTAGTKVEMENPGDADLRVFWLAEGMPVEGKSIIEDRGIVARRKIFTRDGQEITAPYDLTRGETYEIQLSIRGTADDLAVVDLLPAGLEIEDAALKGRRLAGDAVSGMQVKHVERRDDRLMVFGSLSGEGEYRYLVRAVTNGVFAWPALDASRMYAASTRSVSGEGELRVTSAREAANDK